jgi:phosphoribosyl 1,2-cyclic phosphodiesterase
VNADEPLPPEVRREHMIGMPEECAPSGAIALSLRGPQQDGSEHVEAERHVLHRRAVSRKEESNHDGETANHAMKLRFLGTGASGGTPGKGRSRRHESSLLIEDEVSLMIDATRDFPVQSTGLEQLDAVLLTHAHRDAAGGVPALGRWCRAHRRPRLRTLASPEAIAVLATRHRRLDHLDALAVEPGERHRVGPFRITALEVPHARDPRFRTYAWRLRIGGITVVYASDVARLEPSLKRFADGADILVIDGAMWRRRLFAHLTIDRALPELCRWPSKRILLTQIGRTAPPHEQLEHAVAQLCPRAAPAWDGLVVNLD